MSVTQWQIGQEVDVAPRTWPGINKPGGVGKIIKIHFSSLGVVDSLDVKYVLGNNTDTNLEPDLVKPHVELDRGRRSRRGRDFFTVAPTTVEESKKQATAKKGTEADKENDNTNTDVVAGDKETASLGKKRKDNASKISKNGTKHKKKNKKSHTATSTNKKSDKPSKQNKPAQRTKNAEKEESEKRDETIPESIPRFIVTTTAASANPLSPLVAHVRDEIHNIDSSLLHQRTDGQRQEEDRCQQFGKHFSMVMTSHEDENEDMTLQKLVEAINSSIQADQACKAFTVGEVDRFVSRLCAEGKVMKSNGFYYATI